MVSEYDLKYLHYRNNFPNTRFLGGAEQDNYFRNTFWGAGGGAHTYVKVCEEEPSVTCMKYIDFKMVSFNTEIYLKDTSYFFFLNEVTLSKAVMPAVCWS